MPDLPSFDQLKTFIAAAEEGSFSAAGRRLSRAQSAVSQGIAALENQLGVLLFDRSSRYPRLTDHGRMLLADAKAIGDGFERFRAKARGMSGGLEAELSVVVDVMFPLAAIAQAAKAFAIEFPTVSLRVYVEALGAVVQHVIEGRCSLGIVGSLPDIPDTLSSERLVGIPMGMVVAPSHPLGTLNRPATREELAEHTQLILTDRTSRSEGKSFGVFSRKTWKLADLSAKHAFLLDGLGWGAMPLNVVENDLATGRLVRLGIEDEPLIVLLPIVVAYPTAAPPGPAGRWLIDTLRTCSREHHVD